MHCNVSALELLPSNLCLSPITKLHWWFPLPLQEASEDVTTHQTHEQRLVDYISFRIPDESFSNIRNCIGITRGFMGDLSSVKKGNTSLEAILLSVPDGYHCVDLCLYKVKILWVSMLIFLFFATGLTHDFCCWKQESQIVLLLNESTSSSEISGNACMMIVQASDLPFASISRSTGLNDWDLHKLMVYSSVNFINILP